MDIDYVGWKSVRNLDLTLANGVTIAQPKRAAHARPCRRERTSQHVMRIRIVKRERRDAAENHTLREQLRAFRVRERDAAAMIEHDDADAQRIHGCEPE